MKKYSLTAAAAVAGLALASCGGPQGWSIEGTVNGAEAGSRLAIEACNAGHWYVLDSVAVAKNGTFRYTSGEPAPDADVMRVTMPGKGSVYFPVNGRDAVTLEAEAATFGAGHRLGGTDMARTVSAIDSIAASGADIAAIRASLAGFVVSDTTGIIAYYTVGKSVGKELLFDPADNYGNRIYGAAAQVYAHYKPLDPHGQALKAAYFAGRKALGKTVAAEPETVVELPESGYIDITRYDSRGVSHSVSEAVRDNRVVLLNFTAYDQDYSPAYNKALNDLYQLYGSKGLQIYQIAFDQNEAEWKAACASLPWIAVWNSPADGADALVSYNVGALPVTFVIRDGAITDRVVDPAELPRKVAPAF